MILILVLILAVLALGGGIAWNPLWFLLLVLALLLFLGFGRGERL